MYSGVAKPGLLEAGIIWFLIGVDDTRLSLKSVHPEITVEVLEMLEILELLALEIVLEIWLEFWLEISLL